MWTVLPGDAGDVCDTLTDEEVIDGVTRVLRMFTENKTIPPPENVQTNTVLRPELSRKLLVSRSDLIYTGCPPSKDLFQVTFYGMICRSLFATVIAIAKPWTYRNYKGFPNQN